MNWLDPTGAAFSLASTYYFTTARRLAWLLGIIAIILNAILYAQKGIYGQLLLEGVYFLSMIYGWYQWSYDFASGPRPIRYLNFVQCLKLILIAIISIFVMAYALKTWTNSTIPYWDATTTILSLLAQWLLCLKIIHCWALWFVVDALVACLQFYKGIPFHSAIHWMYLIFAILGYYRWRKIYERENAYLLEMV